MLGLPKVERSQKGWSNILLSSTIEAVLDFVNTIPEHLKKTVKSVCTDIYAGFVNTAIEVCNPQEAVVYRYHVAKLYPITH